MLKYALVFGCVFFFSFSLLVTADDSEPFPGLQAVYLRPEILSEDAATTYMKHIKMWGANEVFLEAGYNNGVLNLSNVFSPIDPQEDWLTILCTAAKKEGLKVHVWIKVCFWIHKIENLSRFPLLQQHPEWIDLNRNGEIVTNTGTYEEKNFIFVNPAAPGVMQALKDYINELAEYDIDGISIDYIRFKATRPEPETWFGYNKYSVEIFKHKTGIDPLTIEPDYRAGSPFMQWVQYNEQVIENCVKEISEFIDTLNKTQNRSIILSASPFTGYVSGKSSKFQNWKPWDDKGYIDLWMPMCMSIDMQELVKELLGVKMLGLKAPYYPVIYPNQHGSLHPPMVPHYNALKEAGITRFAVFSYKQLKEDMGRMSATR